MGELDFTVAIESGIQYRVLENIAGFIFVMLKTRKQLFGGCLSYSFRFLKTLGAMTGLRAT